MRNSGNFTAPGVNEKTLLIIFKDREFFHNFNGSPSVLPATFAG